MPHPHSSSVTFDFQQGGYLAATHLLSLGHRHLLHFSSESLNPDMLHVDPRQQCLTGYQQACHEFGLDPTRHLHYSPLETRLNQSAYIAMKQPRLAALSATVAWVRKHPLLRMLRSHPEITAILAPNDPTAVIYCGILQRGEYRIPHDISVVGFDDTEALFDSSGQNTLTTVRIPLRQTRPESRAPYYPARHRTVENRIRKSSCPPPWWCARPPLPQRNAIMTDSIFTLHPEVLTCEYLEQPVGHRYPGAAPELDADSRGARAPADAYQVLVAASADALQAECGECGTAGKSSRNNPSISPTPARRCSRGSAAGGRCAYGMGRGRVSAYSAPAYWEMGLLQRGGLAGAVDRRAGRAYRGRDRPTEPAFPADPHPRTAGRTPRASIFSGLGYHELYINGQQVGDHVLDPAFTRYDVRTLYVTHDVTELLRRRG